MQTNAKRKGRQKPGLEQGRPTRYLRENSTLAASAIAAASIGGIPRAVPRSLPTCRSNPACPLRARAERDALAARHSATGATKAADNGMLFSGHDAARLLDRRQNGVFVERLHAECVDNLCGNAFSGQQVSGLRASSISTPQATMETSLPSRSTYARPISEALCPAHRRTAPMRGPCAHTRGPAFRRPANGGLRSVVVGGTRTHVRQHAHKWAMSSTI